MPDQLTAILQSLYAHLGSPGKKAFFTKLLPYATEKFPYSVFTSAMKGSWPKRKEGRDRIEHAVQRFSAKENIDLHQVLQTSAKQKRDQVQPIRLPKVLRGAWFLIQYRGKREAIDDALANLDFRVAVLVYGQDEGGARKLQIVGETTVWDGDVRAQDKQLYYSATETSREGIDESLSMVMLEVYGAGKTVDHHGIIVGIARGEHDAPNFPIYASRAILWRLKALEEKMAPLSEDEITELRKYCGYISASQAAEKPEAQDPLVVERAHAIQRFDKKGQRTDNFGDRLFVRS